MKPTFKQNEHCLLNTVVRRSDKGWVGKNTAILIVHGIGTQLPVETLDQFGRGLVKQYKKEFGTDLKLSHKLADKTENGKPWYDNVLRITQDGSPYFIDLYEYYWANYTQDKATWKDLNTWLQGVVNGAKAFYKQNAALGQQYKDKSPFFDKTTGRFKVGKYRFFLTFFGKLFFILDALYKGIIWLVSLIPFVGKAADSLVESYIDTKVHDIVNIASEVAIYNVVDPKSKFYNVRRKILDGAVDAVQWLVEKEDEKAGGGTELRYPSLIIAGHSLGSQVAYDAINMINLKINREAIKNYNQDGTYKNDPERKIVDQLHGFITFGCPLDKIIFFLREQVPNNQYLRQQILNDFHGFKQRDLDSQFNNAHTNKDFVKVETFLERLLEKMKWRNYFDDKDYVSGGLDYYYPLTNINCQFKKGWFTHSNYWDCDNFYIDIISNYLVE